MKNTYLQKPSIQLGVQCRHIAYRTRIEPETIPNSLSHSAMTALKSFMGCCLLAFILAKKEFLMEP